MKYNVPEVVYGQTDGSWSRCGQEMRIKRLILENVRNIDRAELDNLGDIVIIVGLNGIHYHCSPLRIYRMCLAFTRLGLTTSLVESTASLE